MRNLRIVSGVLFLFGTIFATHADAAAPWTIQGVVTKVALWDKANGPSQGSAKLMQIQFATTGKVCSDTNTSIAEVGSTESTTLWDHWVRTAQSALLSGRELRIQTNMVSGVCKTEYLELWN